MMKKGNVITIASNNHISMISHRIYRDWNSRNSILQTVWSKLIKYPDFSRSGTPFANLFHFPWYHDHWEPSHGCTSHDDKQFSIQIKYVSQVISHMKMITYQSKSQHEIPWHLPHLRLSLRMIKFRTINSLVLIKHFSGTLENCVGPLLPTSVTG